MGDHFVLLMDRLLTESTLEAIESMSRLKQSTASANDDIKIDCSSHDIVARKCSTPGKMVECRICQDEDEDSNMETPCSCRGSLKYAHRRCVQRWCDEKGDTVCEICHQPFKPGYIEPPPLFQLSSMPMHFRGNWEITRRELHMNNPRFIAIVSADRNFLHPEDDEHTESASRSIVCCRSVALICMVLLFLRHTLPVLVTGFQDYSLPLILLVLLQTCGILLPIYLILKAVNTIQRRQWQQRSPNTDNSTDEEAGLPTLQHQPQLSTQ